MNNTTIVIVGNQRSGNSCKVAELIAGRKHLRINASELILCRTTQLDDEVIVIDGITEKYLNPFRQLVSSETMKIRPLFSRKLSEIERPDIIGISSVLTKKHFENCRNITEVIELTPEWKDWYPNEEL